MGHDDRPVSHASIYYAVPAYVVAAVGLIMAAPALHLANELQRTSYSGFDRTAMTAAAIGGYLGGGAMIIISIVAAIVAAGGVKVASQGGEPTVLCRFGMVLSGFTALLWVACVIAWHAQAWRILQS